jgi:N-acyl-D-amino-acid deacylase
MVAHSMAEEDLRAFLRHPMTMIGSDGAAPGSSKLPHPRLAGTFARFLGRYVRDQGVLDVPEAIRRITSLPARVFGIPLRGELKPGSYADVVAVDMDGIIDLATFSHPLQQARGVEHVFVNGGWTVRHGDVLGSGAGRRLLRVPPERSGASRA